MRILFVAPNYLPHIGGVEKHIQNLCKELLKDQHKITILLQKYENSYKDYEQIGNLEIIRLNKNNIRFGNRIIITKYLFLNIIKILHYDVIHFHDFSTFMTYGLPIYPILKLFGKKTYVTFHGWEGHVPPLKTVIIKRKIVEKLVNGNMCIGHYIQTWYGTKANIIMYGGVNYTNLLSSNKEKYVLFIGRLANDTGIWNYLRAWEVISQKYRNLEFIICGDGILRIQLESYIANKKINNVRFKGFVNDVESYIKDSKVVFTAGYLGILEAFSLKKTVIATYDNQLKKDYLTMIPNFHNMLWIASDVNEIIRAFDDAMIDQNKKEVAYEFAKKNSWKNLKLEYYKLWKI